MEPHTAFASSKSAANCCSISSFRASAADSASPNVANTRSSVELSAAESRPRTSLLPSSFLSAAVAACRLPRRMSGFRPFGFASSPSTTLRCAPAACSAMRRRNSPRLASGGESLSRRSSYASAKLRRPSTFFVGQLVAAFSAQASTAPQVVSSLAPMALSAAKTAGHGATRASNAWTVAARLSCVFLSSPVVFLTSASSAASCVSTTARASLSTKVSTRPFFSASVGGGRPSKPLRRSSNLLANSRIATAVSLSPSLVACMNSCDAIVCTLLKMPTIWSDGPSSFWMCGHHGCSASRLSKAPPTFLPASSFSASPR
mmetsp:Transcript_81056/g.229531  ORF Transcript_81056/g.229531 Transcript_81056/m.229531 type:complete len:317 (+) Transcript_81056:1597-2547(+)